MKLAVLADIHANFVALQRVTDHIAAWRPDVVIVAGDIVNRGPRPRECLDFIQERQQTAGWRTVRGNHEDYVINQAQKAASHTPLEREFYRFSYWTYQQLGGQISPLAAMPFQQSLTTPDNSEARIVHASMRSTRDGVFPMTSDDELRQKIKPPPALLCVGHTHWPLIRDVDNTLVVNVGAVGLPFDQDWRASYAQLTWRNGRWQPEIIRLAYDRRQAERDFSETGFLEKGGPLTHLILDELQTARSHLFSWTRKYQAPILAGEISVARAVQRFMADM